MSVLNIDCNCYYSVHFSPVIRYYLIDTRTHVIVIAPLQSRFTSVSSYVLGWYLCVIVIAMIVPYHECLTVFPYHLLFYGKGLIRYLQLIHDGDTRLTRESNITPDSKVHVANMGPTWVLSVPGGPHVGHMNFAIWNVWEWWGTVKRYIMPRRGCVTVGHQHIVKN